MIVVSDTSPINYLILIDVIDLLPQLYGRVLVPTHVCQELLDPVGPPRVREWAAAPPNWLEVRPVSMPLPEAALAALDRGEQEAISLAAELQLPLLIDDRRGRGVAQAHGLRVVGTLGILGAAAQRGLVDLRATVEQLTQQTNFRIAPELLQSFLERLMPGPALLASEPGDSSSPPENPALEPGPGRGPGRDLEP